MGIEVGQRRARAGQAIGETGEQAVHVTQPRGRWCRKRQVQAPDDRERRRGQGKGVPGLVRVTGFGLERADRHLVRNAHVRQGRPPRHHTGGAVDRQPGGPADDRIAVRGPRVSFRAGHLEAEGLPVQGLASAESDPARRVLRDDRPAAPRGDAVAGDPGEGVDPCAVVVVPLRGEDAAIGDAVEHDREVVVRMELPGPGSDAADGAVGLERDDGGGADRRRDDLVVTEQLVRARHLAATLPLQALARVPMRRRHQPAVRIHVELVDADLVFLSASHEPRMEDQVVLTGLRVVPGGVVAGRAVARGRRGRLAGDRTELPVSHQLHAEGGDRDVVEQRARPARDVRELVSGRVEVRTVGIA